MYGELIPLLDRVKGPSHADTTTTRYNAAVELAKHGRKAEALALLRNAVEHGFDLVELLEEPEWGTLLNGPELDAIVEAARKNAAQRN